MKRRSFLSLMAAVPVALQLPDGPLPLLPPADPSGPLWVPKSRQITMLPFASPHVEAGQIIELSARPLRRFFPTRLIVASRFPFDILGLEEESAEEGLLVNEVSSELFSEVGFGTPIQFAALQAGEEIVLRARAITAGPITACLCGEVEE